MAMVNVELLVLREAVAASELVSLKNSETFCLPLWPF